MPTAAGSEHRIGCTLPEAFQQAKPGERVWLDDGKIGGVIERVTSDEIDLLVTDVRPGGVNLRAAKGINFPDTDLRLEARLAAPRHGSKRLRTDAAAWRVLELLPRLLVLTGPIVERELAIPLKSASAALRDLVAAGVLVEHGTTQQNNAVGRPSRLYICTELLGLAESNPLRAR